MKEHFYLNGYEFIKDNNINYIDNFPEFPNKNSRSKKTFQTLERIILTEKELEFPLNFNITERVVELHEDTSIYFSTLGLKKLIDRDKEIFKDTKTFFKIKISWVSNVVVLVITYYTIDNQKGLINCFSLNDMLDNIFINYNTKQFTTKRNEYLKKFPNLKIDEIKQIPIIPVRWLDDNIDNYLSDLINMNLIE